MKGPLHPCFPGCADVRPLHQASRPALLSRSDSIGAPSTVSASSYSPERRSPDPASSQAPSKPRSSESVVQLGPEHYSVRPSIGVESIWQPYQRADSVRRPTIPWRTREMPTGARNLFRLNVRPNRHRAPLTFFRRSCNPAASSAEDSLGFLPAGGRGVRILRTKSSRLEPLNLPAAGFATTRFKQSRHAAATPSPSGRDVLCSGK